MYDALGRVASVSNPYRTTGDATYGVTSYQYDTLGRVTKVIPPDGSSSANNISASYASNTATVTDQAGKKRQSTIDGLGRLTQITEDPGGLGYVTTYSYDALSNLTSVMQNGGRQRTFVYDALSRLVCESNPEIQIATCPNPDNGSYTAGTIRYGYDNGGNLTSRQAPAPNQTGSATVTTTYSYDALHRLTQRSYNDGVTSAASFGYDESSIWGATLLNPIGRLTHTSVASTAYSAMSYDAVGRTLNQWQWTPTNWNTNVSGSFPVAYTYDLAGDTTSASNGMGVMISYAYDAAARPTIVTSSLVDAQHPATLATVDSTLGYYPHGALRKMTPGNGLTQTAAFNNALQPCRMNVNSSGAALGACADAIPSGNVQDFNYAFNAGTSDNGNVMSWTATGQQAFSRSFAYDSLNRLATMQETSGNAEGCKPGSSPTNPYTLSWTIDPWGNRTNQTPSAGTCSFSQTVNSQNQLVGPPYQYDAAGNMTNDGNHAYFYDAENRLVQVDGGNTAIYVYDAYGHRVRSAVSGTSRDYVYNSDSVVAEWYSSCSCWGMGYVYANGSPLAQYANSTTYFAHKDHLGSTRLLTAMDQSIYDNMDYLPFGEQIAGGSGTTHKFTGDERDAETGLDHTWFRQYSSQLGRWMHPDPAGLAAVDPTNPQSWNRYAYVLNNPCSLVDPFGLCSFNIGVYATVPFSKNQLKALQNSLESIFATAGVGVKFDFSGNADFSLSIVPSGTLIYGLTPVQAPANVLGSDPRPNEDVAAFNHGVVFFDRAMSFYGLSSTSPTVGAILGRVGAHEAGHYLLNMLHNPPGLSGLGGIMDERVDALNPNLGFTAGQSIQLQHKCKKLRGGTRGGGGGSGDGPTDGPWNSGGFTVDCYSIGPPENTQTFCTIGGGGGFGGPGPRRTL